MFRISHLDRKTNVVRAYIVAALDVLHMYIILLKVQRPPHEVTISQFSLPEICERLVVHLQCKLLAIHKYLSNFEMLKITARHSLSITV